MMTILFWGIGLLFILYICMTIGLILGWKNARPFTPTPQPAASYTIIIPVRNEAKNILFLLEDLNQQHFQNFEVIIVNDQSDDDTVSLVESFSSTFKLRLIHLSDKKRISPKKAAIKQAIAIAQGDVIVTTDGDCRVGPYWLDTINSFYQTHQPALISAGVTFYQEKNWFEKVQTIEFMSLIGAGAISMHFGNPNMCNGANLIYKKSVFLEVNGFEGSEHLASGDDEFLMHKVHQVYPEGVLFLKSPLAVVKTKAQPSLKAFIHQRKRWASKWNHYTNWHAIALAIFIYAFHIASLMALALIFFSPAYRWPLLGLVVLKSIAEHFYLSNILCFFGKRKLTKLIPLTQLLYSVYIIFIGALGQSGSYFWKGRKLK